MAATAIPVATDDMAGAVLARVSPSPLLAIDQNRTSVIDRVVGDWGEALAASNAGINVGQLREILSAMRADQLLAASLAGSLEGLRNVVAIAIVGDSAVKPSLLQAKALGDAAQDVVYVPVTPCRLVDTRGTFPAVYAGGAYAPFEVRTYTVEGGNGSCLSQLPASLSPTAVQMQVFALPTAGGSGDVEILPQGAALGSTATLVFLGNVPVTTVSTTTLVNLANKQISVQVRGGALHLAIDVVGFFRAPNGGFVSSVTAGAGLTGGGTGAVSLAVNTSTIQSRVTATCAVGSFIRAIASNGTVTCGTPPVETLYAVVASDGTLQRGVGVTAANRVGVAGSGTYEVIFNRDVRACVFTATLGGGTIATFLGEVNATGRAGDVNGVFVDTNNSDGTAADKGFHLLVNC